MKATQARTSRSKTLACLALAALLCFALQPTAVWAADGETSEDVVPEVVDPGETADETPDQEGGEGSDPEMEDPSDPAADDEGAASDQGSGAEGDGSDADADSDADESDDDSDGSGDTADEKDKDSSDKGKDDASDSSKKGSDKKKDSDSDEDDDALSSADRAHLKSAYSSIDDSNAAIASVPGAVSALRSAKAAYDEVADELDGFVSERRTAQARMVELARIKAVARPAADAAQAELDEIEQIDPCTYAVKNGISVLEAKKDEDQLRWIAETAGAVADDAEAEYAACEKKAADLDGRIKEQAPVVADALKAANDCAYAAETACSESRSGEVAAAEALAEIDAKDDEVTEARSDLESLVDAHKGTRSSAYAVLDEWYDSLDRRAGAEESRLTFGTGLEFALDEEAFVAKWGAAIDAYYNEIGAPLAGYGENMAREAWDWKIDPRLCAAVSFTESGGGRACIRHCNAWGWGAADSDPYNLASEWASWEEAIAAWHRGMATNPYGMGMAGAVDELGCTYAGAPHWSANVVMAMDRIEELAVDAQPGTASQLTLSQSS